MEDRRMQFPSDDDIIASLAHLNAGPPHPQPTNYHMHFLPEVAGFYQAGREFLSTDVFSERCGDMICVSIPPESGDDEPVVYHCVEKEKITMSTEMPPREREFYREKFAKLNEKNLDRMKHFIGRYKEFILREMCEKEADRRHLTRKSNESADGVPSSETVMERPMSVKWRFFEMTRSASPEPTLRMRFKDDPSFVVPDDQAMVNSMEGAISSTGAHFIQLPTDGTTIVVESERWRDGIHNVTESIPQGFRPDWETPPEVSIYPDTGIPPNELLTLDEEERRTFAENRNRDQYRRDNEIFGHKKGMMRRFLMQQSVAEMMQVDEPISSDGSNSTSSSSNASRSVYSPTISPHHELFGIEEEVERRIARETRANERHQKLVEDHERHIRFLLEVLHILFWRFSHLPNIVPSVVSLVECIAEEKELLESFQRDR